MPYRRLPNTDQARVRVLRTALEESDRQHLRFVISYKTQHDLKMLLQKFEQAMGLYKQTYENQVNSNKDFQLVFRNARLYVSHFIQVLNLSVQRGEIKPEQKKLYHLDPNDYSVPDMVTADLVLDWGNNIIEGEKLRTKAGGIPFYNPAIAKVKVHYDIFKEYRDNQTFLQQNTTRYAEKVNELRQPIDDLIVDVWNQIEGFFNELPPFQRMEICKQYGIIYYYRKGEAELTPADDLPKPKEVIVSEELDNQINETGDAPNPQVMAESIIIDEEIVTEPEMPATPDVEEMGSTTIAMKEIVPEDTLFEVDSIEMEPETIGGTDETPELKMDSVIPKKRQKRTAKQDTLLSLFFQ